ncbi:MAG: amidohydrolase family protein [Phycisphaerales bacterium]
MIRSGTLVLVLVLGAVPLAAQRQPTIPPPSIVDYRPRSTLVVPAHPTPRPKYPVVDFHGHPPFIASPDVANQVGAQLDSIGIGVMLQTIGSSGERLTQQIAAAKASRYADRFGFFTTLNLGIVNPGDGEKLAKQLEADIAAGALGVGEIGKGFGLSARKADGSRLAMDDPKLDPVWRTAARLKIPVFIHPGDPASFFEPLDYTNERWLEMALFPNRQFNDRSRFPTFDALMAERERLIARHPDVVWVLAHLGWYAHDLAKLGALFDKYPSVHAEVGAILYDLGRQPRTARRFFERYQDRILFGKDAFNPDEYPYFWRVFETEDEYFDYYRDYHAFWKLYGMGLPDGVLRKLYHANALRLMPRLPRAALPAGM